MQSFDIPLILNITSTVFDSNMGQFYADSISHGGALQLYGQSVICSMNKVIFSKNHAGNGAAVSSLLGVNIEAINVEFTDNFAGNGTGGAMLVMVSSKQGKTSVIIQELIYCGKLQENIACYGACKLIMHDFVCIMHFVLVHKLVEISVLTVLVEST